MSKSSTSADGKESGGHGHLTLWIVVSIVAAVVLALALPQVAVYFDLGGQIFLRLLQMVVVPLVMASVMSGILGLGDVRKLGKPGACAVGYYLSTTVLAVTTGLVVVNLVNPGKNINPKLVSDAQEEGAREVAKAKSAMDDGDREITWNGGIASLASKNGESDVFSVENRREVNITLVQVGQAQEPARVDVLWSKDGESFQQLEQEIETGAAPDSYSTTVSLPEKAKFVKLEYEAQRGGGSSQVSAVLARGPPTIVDIFKNLVLMLFTDNLLASMVEINLLPLIVFSIVFAGMLTTMGNRAKTISDLVFGINDALMSFILLLMKVAPLGIFCLVAARFGQAQLEGSLLGLLRAQSWYMLTVLTGLAIHAFVTLPLLLWVFTRRNPYRFFAQMSQAVLTAFSTASSTATLPVTMETAEMKAGVSKQSTEFVLPLGATINMDGTALYEAAAAIFIAQAFATTGAIGDLTMVQQLTIAVTATLAAIGAAGIPEAGLVTMLIVLNAVGLPLELIGLIIPVDWLLDRFRTAVNVFGDAVGCAVIAPTFESESEGVLASASKSDGAHSHDSVASQAP